MRKRILTVLLLSGAVLFSVPAVGKAEEITDGAVLDETALKDIENGESGGYLPIAEDDMAPAFEDSGSRLFRRRAGVPVSYDPRDGGYGYTLPDIHNQEPYGTCWAFSANALQELSLQKAGLGMQDLSELQLAYFTYHSVTDPLGGTSGDSVKYVGTMQNYLMRGGNYSYASAALMNWVGTAEESRAPYSKAAETISSGLDASLAYDADVCHLQNVYQINIQENRDGVKEAVMTYGGVGISYKNSQKYYNSTYNSYYNYSDTTTDHAVTIVGWDDTFPKSNFNQEPSGDGAWLIRNSWGTDDGMGNGYFWMSYEDASIAKTAYVMQAESASNYDHNYIYDGSIASSGWGGDSSVTAANVFTISANSKAEELKAVSFYAYQTANAEYQIQIYVNPTDDTNPESGTLISGATTSGFVQYAGYYTIPLEQSVLLKNGDKAAVVVTLRKSDGVVYLGKEYSYSSSSFIESKASAKAGQSLLKDSDGTWVDFGAAKDANFRINAYTTDCNSAETYTITFDANGGTMSAATKTAVKNALYGILETPVRNGLTFLGWYTKPEGGEKISNGDVYLLSSDQKLYARWSGWEIVDGQVQHFFDENGNMIKNQFVCDGTYTYFIQNDGTPMKNRLTYHPDGVHLIYFDENGHELFDTFKYCEDVGYTCYFNTFGYAIFDEVTFYNDRAYYLNACGKMEQEGWFQFANGVDYGFANGDGTLMNSGFTYDPWGRIVFFHWNGMVARGLITDGIWYYHMDETDGHYLGQFQ